MKKSLVGKTIKSVNNRAVNSWKITFTDGTKYRLFAEDAAYTPFGNIAGLFFAQASEEKEAQVMKLSKTVKTTYTVEVKQHKAKKGEYFLVPIFFLERNNSRKDIFKNRHAFNDQGSVCAILTTYCEVINSFGGQDLFLNKAKAVKFAKKQLKQDASN